MMRFILIIVTGLSFYNLSGQTLVSSLSKNHLELGEPTTYKIVIQNLKNKTLPPEKLNLPFYFEVMSDRTQYQKDTYTRFIEFAIYEEGMFTIPALEIRIDGQTFKTTPQKIQVTNPAKKDDKIYDIIPNQNIHLSGTDWLILHWTSIFWVLLSCPGAYSIYRWVRKKTKLHRPTLSSSINEIHQLEKLRDLLDMEPSDYRRFYVELIQIIRIFLERKHGISSALLTEEIFIFVGKNNRLNQKQIQLLKEVLEHGNHIKFAKIIPTKEMMKEDWIKTQLLIS